MECHLTLVSKAQESNEEESRTKSTVSGSISYSCMQAIRCSCLEPHACILACKQTKVVMPASTIFRTCASPFSLCLSGNGIVTLLIVTCTIRGGPAYRSQDLQL